MNFDTALCIAGLIIVGAVVLLLDVAACMLSSRISRDLGE